MLWVVAALVTVWLVEAPRWSAPLSAADVIAGRAPDLATRLAAAWPAVAAGGLTILVLLAARAWRRRAGALGSTFAVVVAVAVACGLRPWLGAAVVAIGLVAALAAPLLRERGTLSLVLLSLLVAAPIVLARRAALAMRDAAQAFAQLREPLLGTGLQRFLVRVAAELPVGDRELLVRSLRPPFVAEPIDVWLLDDEALVLEIHRAGHALLDLREESLALLPAPPSPEPTLAGAAIRWIPERGPVALLPEPDGRFELRVVAPWRRWSLEVTDPQRRLQLRPQDQAELLADLASLGAGAKVLAHARAVAAGAGTGWLSLAPEP